eukprot:g44768.t1
MIHLGFLQFSQHYRYQSSANLIHSTFIKKQLETLDTAKAMGPDNILAIVLKTCAPELAVPLAKLSQFSYNTGIYPTMRKLL